MGEEGRWWNSGEVDEARKMEDMEWRAEGKGQREWVHKDITERSENKESLGREGMY